MGNKKKKIKNFKLEQDELKPMTIGMFESRKRSSIGTFIILTIFVLVIFFLPQITEIINNYLNPETPIVIDPGNNIPDDPIIDDTPSYDDTFYEYNESLKIINDDITVSSFVVDPVKNTLSFTITNNGAALDIEDLNYYIEIYNKERTLIERVKLANETTLASGAFRELTKKISSESATTIGYLVLVKKTINEYPEVNIKVSEDGSATLVCSNSFEKITYKFKDNKLKELTSEVTHKIEELDYNALYEMHKILVDNYNSKTGIVSTLFQYDAGYNITTNVNLNEASRLYIFSADSFKLDVEPKVVKFEMEAQGFSCE